MSSETLQTLGIILLLNAVAPDRLASIFQHLEPAELRSVRPQLDLEDLADVLDKADGPAKVDAAVSGLLIL